MPSVLAMMQFHLQIYPTTSTVSLLKHKIRTFTIRFIREYIGIRLIGYVEKQVDILISKLGATNINLKHHAYCI